MPSNSQRLDQLTEDWNEAEISRPSLQRWMDQLPNEDHAIAQRHPQRQTNSSGPHLSRYTFGVALGALMGMGGAAAWVGHWSGAVIW